MPISLDQIPLPKAFVRWGLHTYWRFARGMTLGVRGVAIDGEGRVCLIRHTYVQGWHLPGGGVETNETTHEALEREMAEEACIQIVGEPAIHGVFFNRKISRRDHVVVYVLRDFIVTRTKTPDREIAEVGFFPLDRLPEGTTGATRRRLEEIASSEPPARNW